MKTSSRKAKGRDLQYWVARQIGKLFGIEFNNQDDLCPIKSRGMGQSGNDVYLTDAELFEKFPYAVECKNTETISTYAYIRQVKENSQENQEWLVIHKKNYHKPIVILDAEHFFDLYKKLIDAGLR